MQAHPPFDAQSIEAAFGRKKYALSKTRFNFIGVRSDNGTAGKFDDLFVSMKYQKDGWVMWTAPFTTDPGLHFLQEELLNEEGCAILVPGQYENVYKIAKHRGVYDALCQRNGPVRVYRDSNKDDALDCDPEMIREGNFGINIHKAVASGRSGDTVVKASAGCQVFRYAKDFDKMMREAKKEAASINGDVFFTYTLLLQSDI